MKAPLLIPTLFLVASISMSTWANSDFDDCHPQVLNTPSVQLPSLFARTSLGIRFLGHGTSFQNARAAIAHGALTSSRTQDRSGTFATVGTRKPSLNGIFTQAIFRPEALDDVLNYRVSVPVDPQDPDAGGTIETRYFEVILLFDLRPLDESPFYAAPGWSYEPTADKYTEDANTKKQWLSSLKATDLLPTKGKSLRGLANEVVFNLPAEGLSLKYLAGIHIHGNADQAQSLRAQIESDLRQAGWSVEEIASLFLIENP